MLRRKQLPPKGVLSTADGQPAIVNLTDNVTLGVSVETNDDEGNEKSNENASDLESNRA